MKSTAAVTTIAIDLAKNVFQLALADASFRIVRSLRLKRADFLSFWQSRTWKILATRLSATAKASSGSNQHQQRQGQRSGQTSIS